MIQGKMEFNNHIETKSIRIGEKVKASDSNCELLALTSSYIFETPLEAKLKFSGELEGHVYSRISNPTTESFEKRIAAMEYGDDGVAFSSGMAAIDAVLTGLLKPGDHVVCSGNMFGTTAYLFTKFYQQWGVLVDFADVRNLDTWRKLVNKKTKLIFFETPSNPNLYVADIMKITNIAHENGALVIVDNTVATPILTTPLSLGADIVVHSTGKYIDGQGRIGGGVVVSNSEICDLMKAVVRSKGNCISPFNAWMNLKSLETLSLRMKAHSENALVLSKFLKELPIVQQVNYPGLHCHPNFELAKRQHNNDMHVDYK